LFFRMLKFTAACFAATTLLASCATPLPAATAFGPESTTAMLVLAGPPATAAHTTEFRGVDLSTSKFQSEIVEFVNAGFGGHQINGGSKSGVWLSPQAVPAGDYALVAVAIAIMAGSNHSSHVECFEQASPVFSLPPGKIGIVRAERYSLGPLALAASGVSDEVVLQEFAEARKKFPDIRGEAVIVTPRAGISYDLADKVFFSNQRYCDERTTFERLK